ncbi:MAG: hypothetical protein R3A51_21960 [Nannocystaceae bacterium]
MAPEVASSWAALGGVLGPEAVIDPALEPVARVSGEPVATGGAADEPGREVGGLEQQVAGRVRDHGRRPAHDPSEGLRRARVGDHEVVGGERDLAAVEGRKRLPLPSHAHHHAPLGQLVAVEHVERLAPLHQHEVGDVDAVVDRPQADVVEPHPHPQR